MDLNDLRIKVDPKKGADRCLLIGATGSGKSTAAGVLLQLFYEDYVKPIKKNKPRGRIFVIDTKPRWRPEYKADGTKASRAYSSLMAGPIVPNSRLIQSMGDWDLATSTGDGVYVVQQPKATIREAVLFAVEVCEKIFQTQRKDVPTLVVFDEGMDMFGPTGNGKHGDIVQRFFRAGREKGAATLFCSQRPKTINIQCVSESNYLMLFRIDFHDDMKRLHEMSLPEWVDPPADDYHFVLFRNRKLLSQDAVLRV